MEKIITLPVNGGAGTISPINRFQEDMENLMDASADILPDDLITDSLEENVSVENWERYVKIVRGIFAARSTGWDLPVVKYQAQPLMSRDYARITITLPKNSPITNEGKTALAMAILLADEITTLTEKARLKSASLSAIFTAGPLERMNSLSEGAPELVPLAKFYTGAVLAALIGTVCPAPYSEMKENVFFQMR